ncbi:MAG: right-handed parallel beta-helix repeat-containing protein, partial [Bacteroidetes bacterium]|nr:right-handed parallel beta-helix repeat-containing protein [Bacteroidota bacterium]
MKYILLLIFISITSLCQSADLYVSPAGSDAGNGTIEKPYKTIVKARDEARKINEHVTVFLRGGKYKITETIVFGVEDGNVTYKAYTNETPIITSEIAVGQWKKCIDYPEGTSESAKGNLWVVEIPKDVSNFKVLFDGNHRLKRAHSTGFQTPELKFKKLATRNVANKSDFDLLIKLPFPQGAIKNWSNLEDVEVFFCGVPWTQNIIPIESVDLKNNIAQLKFAGNTPPSTTPKPYNPTYIENIIDVLDAPGEWCVNTKTRKIYYWPINGEPSKNISVPTLIEFFKVEGKIDYNGTNDVPVKNINFKGLTFTKGDRYSWWKGHKGYGIQHDWDKFDYGNALLRFRGAENCKVSECSFVNSGTSAIRLDLHAQNITIENSLIDRIGHMGILLCGYGPGTKDVNKNNKIVNNIIRRVGEVIWHGHAIFVWQSGENYIANNHIREVPRKAIGICGVRGAIFQNGKEIDWDEAAKTIRWNELKYKTYKKGNSTQEKILPYLHSRNNLVENNYIYRSRTKIGDGASLNVSGAGTGNILRRNMLY